MYHYTEKIDFSPFIDAAERGQNIRAFEVNCEFLIPADLAAPWGKSKVTCQNSVTEIVASCHDF